MDPFRFVLRDLREAAGTTQPSLAKQMRWWGPTHVCNVEAGRREPTQDFAEAADDALGAGGLLVDLFFGRSLGDNGEHEGDDVYRRALVNALTALGLAGIAGPGLLVEAVRSSLTLALGLDVDADGWEAIVSDYGHDYMTESPAKLRLRLAADLLVLGERVSRDGAADRRVAARLATVQAMATASAGAPADARRWYRVARAAARAAQSPDLEAWVRGREAFRVGYDQDRPALVLTLSRDLPVAEAHLAAAQAHARLGNVSEAIASIDAGRRAHQALGEQQADSIYDLPDWRLSLAIGLVFARCGRTSEANRALDDAVAPGLARWSVQRELCRAIAEARGGDVPSARARMATTLAALPADQQSLTIKGLTREVQACVS